MPETVQTVAPRTPLESQHYELTLSDYFRILIKRRLVIVASFILVLFGSIVYTNTKTPLYATSSSVRISSGPRAFQPGSAFFMPTTDFSTYEEMIGGDEVMKRVVIRLGLLGPDATSEDLMAKAGEISSNINASQLGNTDIISIGIVYPDPALAAAIVNETAEVFVDVELLEKTREARQLRTFIEGQLQKFTRALEETERNIQEFRRSGKATGAALQFENQLANLRQERGLLLKQFTAKHPDIIEIDAQIRNVEKRLKNLPRGELEYARYQRELEINDRAYRMMKDKYQLAQLTEAEYVSDVTMHSRGAVPRHPVSPNKKLNKMTGAVVGILVGIVIAFLLENFDTSIGTIEDVEQIVRLPVIGVVPYYNPGREDIPWWRFDLAIMELISKRAPRDLPPDPAFLIMNQDTSSSLAEAYRILRTFVDFLLPRKEGEKAKMIGVTSTGPQEGKTITACNLAISLAQSGKKTLLIDGDLRRPALHRLFGLSRDPGLTDLLLGAADLNEAKRTLGDILVGETSQWDQLIRSKLLDRLEILPTGTVTTTPAELLISDAMKELMETLRSEYDVIVLDTPPVLPVTDTRTLGKFVDALFFVYRAGKTARRALTRAKEELKLSGVEVRGIILNQATPEVTLTDKYYYQYYGEKKKEQK